MFRCQSQIERK